MKAFILIASFVISSASPYHHHHHRYHGSDENNKVHPPWWHPRTPGGDRPDLGPGRGYGSHSSESDSDDDHSGSLDASIAISSGSPQGFNFGFQGSDEGPFGHRGFGAGSGDDDMYRRPSDHWWNSNSPWTKPTTEKSRVTFPIYTPWITSSTTSSTTTARDTGSSTSKPIGPDLVIESCKKACQVTNEYNPVCGTDNVTYGNMAKLDCARNCGVDVRLKRRSSCGTNGGGNNGGNNGGGNNGGGNNGGGNNGGGNNGGGNNGGGNNGGGNNGGGNNGGGNNGRKDQDVFKIQACMRNCPVTSEYNPVCGTDNVTYTNPGRIECAKNCGLAVNILRRAACNSPVSREEGIEICMTSCTSPTRHTPVCGTDNRTYENEDRLECARNCGRDVQISRRSSCNVPGPNPTLTPNKDDKATTATPDRNCNANTNCNGNGSGGKTMTEIIACMQLCRTTPEINPVCGTDGVTYSNPSQLLCAQSCGVGVNVRMFAPCLGSSMTPGPITTPCATTSTPTEVPSCETKCMVSPELKPVCGTNGKTYMNIESLLCLQRCGVAVKLLKNSACGSTEPTVPTAGTPPVWANTDRPTQPTVATPRPNLQTCINMCTNSQDRKPVCGTDGITYANLQSLNCAKNCGKNVSVKSQSACLGGSKDETTTDNDVGFTIPHDILISVFPDYKPDTTTTSKPNDSDESFDLDERYGEATS